MHAQTLIQSFQYTADTLQLQLCDITHAESLLQPIAGGHSINWLLGHIVSSRSIPLSRVNAAPVWDDSIRARYRNGSQPITEDAPDVLSLSALKSLFALTHERLIDGLSVMTEAQLKAHSGYGENSVFQSFLYFHFHEAYHVGQLTMIAESLGYSAAYPM